MSLAALSAHADAIRYAGRSMWTYLCLVQKK